MACKVASQDRLVIAVIQGLAEPFLDFRGRVVFLEPVVHLEPVVFLERALLLDSQDSQEVAEVAEPLMSKLFQVRELGRNLMA